MRAGSKPVSQRIFARNLRVDSIRVARRDHFMKDFPNGIAIRLSCRANFHGRKSQLQISRASLLSPDTPRLD